MSFSHALIASVAALGLYGTGLFGASTAPLENAPADSVAWSMTPVITDTGVERSNFSYAVDAGATISDAVLIRNSGGTELTLSVFGADAVTDDTGRLDIATVDATDSGAWITSSQESVSIAPGAQVRVPFTVAVPADAEPGEHSAALLTVLPSVGESVSVDMRYATRVTVTVSGELTAGLSLDGAAMEVSPGFWPWDAASAQVSYTAKNTGNTRLTAPQLIRAQGVELYSGVDESFTDLTELLPAAAVPVSAKIDGLALWSPFVNATVSVSPSVISTASGEVPIVEQAQVTLEAVAIAPGWWVLLGALVLVIVLVVMRVRKKKA